VESKESIKISNKGKQFLKQIQINQIKLDIRPTTSYGESIELMQKYFKLNNDQYLKMLNMEEKKDGN